MSSIIETAYVEVLPKTDRFRSTLEADTSKAASSAGAQAGTSFRSAFDRSVKGRGGSTTSHSSVNVLLGDVRGLSREADDLSGRLAGLDTQATTTRSSLGGVGVGSLLAGVAVNTLGRNLGQLDGELGKAGRALSALSTGDFVGFYKAAHDSRAATAAFTAELVASGDAAAASQKANLFAAQGFDAIANAARAATLQILANQAAQAGAIVSPGEGRLGGPDAISGVPLPRDTSSSAATRNATAESIAARTKALSDDLAVAKREAAEAARIEKEQRATLEGRAQRHRDTVEAETKVIAIERQIEDQRAAAAREAAAARKRAADEARRAAEERARARAAALAAAHRDYTNELDFRQSLLELSVRRAGLTEKTVADDKKAQRKLIAFLKREAHDKKLTNEERRAYLLAALGADIDLKGIKTPADAKAKAAAVTGSSFSIGDLFSAASAQFGAYGSNIAGRNGILSGQDARASLGRSILEQIQGRALTEAERQTALLVSIDQRLSTARPGAERATLEIERYATIQGLRGTAMAAYYGYGVN